MSIRTSSSNIVDPQSNTMDWCPYEENYSRSRSDAQRVRLYLGLQATWSEDDEHRDAAADERETVSTRGPSTTSPVLGRLPFHDITLHLNSLGNKKSSS